MSIFTLLLPVRRPRSLGWRLFVVVGERPWYAGGATKYSRAKAVNAAATVGAVSSPVGQPRLLLAHGRQF
jgi:hypothetical protein